MESRLLSDFHGALGQNPNLSDKCTTAALSLIRNPFTTDPTLYSLLKTLAINLQNPNFNHHHLILSLLAIISRHHPDLRPLIVSAVQEFVIQPSVPIPSLLHALSLLVHPAHSNTTRPDPFSDESLFLSLCFWQCLKTRRWVVKNVREFGVRPSVLLTVLLGISKDPYPYIREAALDGMALLSKGIAVEDRSLIESCYFRATELLFDAENSVRCSAIRAVSQWGHLLVALSPDESKRDWSDALFIQLCLMTRDMDMKIRVSAFDALGKIQMVSEDILLQTLSKKAFESAKEKNYPGHYTAKLLKIPGSAAAFTFIHGLQDEFHEVRISACHALQMLTVFSSEFAGEAVHVLMDVLNDDSMVVRLQTLETLHYISLCGHLRVEESHLHMFLGALTDGSPTIRSASRKAIQSTKLPKLMMFKLCIDGLVKNLELYPQDEADIFSVLFKIGCVHGKFVANHIEEIFLELEPSFDGKLGFHHVRTAALLVLAISAPVSFEREICGIPPQIFSYAVTLLGRISNGLVDLMDQNTLLAYLSHCSRFTFVSATEFFKGEKDSDVHWWEKSDGISGGYFDKLMGLKNVTAPHQDLFNSNDKATNYANIIFQKVVDLWPLLQLGCMNEVIPTLRISRLFSSSITVKVSIVCASRSWKYELKNFTRDSHQSAGVLVFALNYLHVLKCFGKAWTYCFSLRNLQCNGMGVWEAQFCKTERRLKEMLKRYIGLSRQEELYILELILVTCTLRLSFGATCCSEAYINELNSVMSRVDYLHKEGSIELSDFVIELQNTLHEFNYTEEGASDMLHQLQKCLDCFKLKHLVLSRELNYLEADMDFCDNDFLNPLPFVPGLPVGIPLEITLYNISSETKLWLTMTLTGKLTQFVFLDLHEFGGCNEIRKFAFVAPFYRTPKAKYCSIKVSIAMKCLSEVQRFKHCNGPKHELIQLCKEKEVYLSMAR